MDKTKIPEEFQNMSVEEVLQDTLKRIQRQEAREVEIYKLVLELLAMYRSSIEESSIQRLRAEQSRADEKDDKYSQLIKEKGEEHTRLMDMIVGATDNVYEIGMEIAKRIEALKHLKHSKRYAKEDRKEIAAIEFAIEELQKLLPFIQNRLIPVPNSRYRM